MKYVPDRKVWMGGVLSLVAWAMFVIASQFGMVEFTFERALALVGMVWPVVTYMIKPSQMDVVKRVDDTILSLVDKLGG